MNLYNLIQQFIKLADDEFLQETNQYIDQHIPEAKKKTEIAIPRLLDILKKRKIYPISSADNKVLLGEGVYSRVFEVDYKGKRAVAKITEYQHDFDMMILLNKLKPQLGEHQKHLPIIYDFFKARDYMDRYWYIMIVEYLQQTNSHVADMLFGYSELLWRHNKQQSKKPEDQKEDFSYQPNKIRIQLLKEYKKDIRGIIQDNYLKYFNDTPEENIILEIIKFIDNNLSHDETDANQFIILLNSDLENLLYDQNLDEIDIGLFIEAFDLDLADLINNIVFPKYEKDFTEDNIFKELPESKSLIECLLKLRQLGVSWADLHAENIMERPSNKELVISDPGNFILV